MQFSNGRKSYNSSTNFKSKRDTNKTRNDSRRRQLLRAKLATQLLMGQSLLGPCKTLTWRILPLVRGWVRPSMPPPMQTTKASKLSIGHHRRLVVVKPNLCSWPARRQAKSSTRRQPCQMWDWVSSMWRLKIFNRATLRRSSSRQIKHRRRMVGLRWK